MARGGVGRVQQPREPLILPRERRLVPNAQRVDGLNLKERIRLEIENEKKVKAAVDYKIENLRKLKQAYRHSQGGQPPGAAGGRARGRGGVADEVGLAEERLMQIHREREEVRRQALRFERQQLAQRRESPVSAAAPPPMRQEEARPPPRLQAGNERYEQRSPTPGGGVRAEHVAARSRDPSPPPDPEPAGPSRPLNPREARAARKEAEIRKREEELARARQEYAHERQAAQHKQQQIYAPSGHAQPPPQPPARGYGGGCPPAEAESESKVQFRHEAHRPQHELRAAEAQAHAVDQPFEGDIGGRLAQLEMQATAHEHRIYYLTQQMEDEDAMARKIRDDQDSYDSPRQARADARGGLRADVMEQGGLRDKLEEIQSFCVEKLGHELYEGVHKFMQAQSADSVPEDLLRDFGEEMRKQLGPARLHFFPLVDKVVYLEELISQ